MKIESRIRTLFRRFGLDIHRYYRDEPHESKLLKMYGVEAIFDIGANIGQSAQGFRSYGFGGKIVSFEPVDHLFSVLSECAQIDANWFAEKLALGAVATTSNIFVSGGHAGASSMLEMTDLVSELAPDQAVTHQQRVDVSTVDEMVKKHYPNGDRLFLKLDVQGYEAQVLAGAAIAFSKIVGMRLELGLVESYRGESLLYDVLPSMYRQGFRAVAMEPAWVNDKTDELLQMNVTLFRVERVQQ